MLAISSRSAALVEPIAAPDDAALTAWFDEHKATYAAPEYRKISYIKLDPEAIARETLAFVRATGYPHDEITGLQRVSFVPQGDRVAVTLELEYRITDRNLFTPVVDVLFVRGAQRASLTRTLQRFRQELGA